MARKKLKVIKDKKTARIIVGDKKGKAKKVKGLVVPLEISNETDSVLLSNTTETETDFLSAMEQQFPLPVKDFKAILNKVYYKNSIDAALQSNESKAFLQRFTGTKNLPKNGQLQKLLHDTFAMKEFELKELAL